MEEAKSRMNRSMNRSNLMSLNDEKEERPQNKNRRKLPQI